MGISRSKREAVYRRDEYLCQICGSQTSVHENNPRFRTLDHIFPVSKGGTDDPDNLQVACQRCNQEKSDMVKLNIGCGEFKQDGWINIDKAPEVEPDVLASALDLPYDDEVAEFIYCGHVLEHLEIGEMQVALKEIERVAAPGAEIMFVGPDIPRASMMLKAGAITQETYDGLIHGACRWEGDEHHWECSEKRMLKFVSDVFENAEAIGILQVGLEWPVVSRVAYQCAVVATKREV